MGQSRFNFGGGGRCDWRGVCAAIAAGGRRCCRGSIAISGRSLPSAATPATAPIRARARPSCGSIPKTGSHEVGDRAGRCRFERSDLAAFRATTRKMRMPPPRFEEAAADGGAGRAVAEVDQRRREVRAALGVHRAAARRRFRQVKQTPLGRATTSIASCSRSRSAMASARRPRPIASRSCGGCISISPACRRRRRRSMSSSTTSGPMLTSSSSTSCWRRPHLASGWPRGGSTSCGSPTRSAITAIRITTSRRIAIT